jgi:16S rRNA pseudouridine516 synthase
VARSPRNVFCNRSRNSLEPQGPACSRSGYDEVLASSFPHFSFAPAAHFCGHARVLVRRLDQLLASLGYCSRRNARDWIASGAVTVRGVKADDFGAKAEPADVLVDGEPLDHPDGLLLLLNKPLGLVCSHDSREGPNVYSLLPERWRRRNPQVTSIGRLDKDTSGLLLLTDQSLLVHRLTSPKHKVPKVYRATLDRDISADLVPLFASGTLRLDDDEAPCAPAELKLHTAREAELTLIEGRYHQVRRMFAACGATVLSLHRTNFGRLDLGDLTPGRWRELPLGFFEAT